MMDTIIISSCLLGFASRYDGAAKKYNVSEWTEKFNVIPVCPEQMGGLPTPREPAEIKINPQGNEIVERVYSGEDVTEPFRKGAKEVLRFCNERGIKKALFKSKSPSCGEEGLTTIMLRENGIEVIVVN